MKLQKLIEVAGSEHTMREPRESTKRALRRLSPKQNAEILRRYQAGERPVDLAKEFGVTEWTIHYRLRRAGIRDQH